MVLIYRVILQDHEMTTCVLSTCVFMSRMPSRQVTILQSLVIKDMTVLEISWF